MFPAADRRAAGESLEAIIMFRSDYAVRKWQMILLAVSIVFIIVGIARGEQLTVFKKAVRICLECIGIG